MTNQFTMNHPVPNLFMIASRDISFFLENLFALAKPTLQNMKENNCLDSQETINKSTP